MVEINWLCWIKRILYWRADSFPKWRYDPFPDAAIFTMPNLRMSLHLWVHPAAKIIAKPLGDAFCLCLHRCRLILRFGIVKMAASGNGSFITLHRKRFSSSVQVFLSLLSLWVMVLSVRLADILSRTTTAWHWKSAGTERRRRGWMSVLRRHVTEDAAVTVPTPTHSSCIEHWTTSAFAWFVPSQSYISRRSKTAKMKILQYYGILNHIRKLLHLYQTIGWYKCASLHMWFVIPYYRKIFIFAVLERRLIHDCETECSFVYLILLALLVLKYILIKDSSFQQDCLRRVQGMFQLYNYCKPRSRIHASIALSFCPSCSGQILQYSS